MSAASYYDILRAVHARKYEDDLRKRNSDVQDYYVTRQMMARIGSNSKWPQDKRIATQVMFRINWNHNHGPTFHRDEAPSVAWDTDPESPFSVY